ncbi:MAG: SDR family oxidoreductase [Gammaproteobacteria bacterium]|jgi:short-subunit dehydrogenase|nr:SDR family oxidoreductase [Gammaproteobacteria bacterium]MBU0770891.1 SDR family oxidoreductase [Gammaproteobacteria bacterium]MBU0856827.1 SDR family oxidoreductase [Gammaproteobacteria bacterium]MBU1845491.1 SDR family oxidoreductase [Gammaproteobacteria bacterium]
MSGALRLVLTGAAGGIGTAVAHALAPRCVSMLLVGRDAARLESLADSLAGRAPGLELRVAGADLTTADGRAAVVAAARDLPGGVNLLVNNAGVGDLSWFEDQSEAQIERIVQTNVLAPMLLVHALLPLLLRSQEAARIVNVGSILGDIGHPGSAAYCASKFALRGFTEALRRELAGGPVQLQYLAPRATRTALNSPAQAALNDELGVASDAPDVVARELMALLDGGRPERHLGWPEKLFVRINRMVPSLVDASLRRQLPVIRRHARPQEKE